MSKTPMKATHQGELVIGPTTIPCFVLEDGTRVISGRGITSAISVKGRGQGIQRITAHSILKPFINNDLVVAIENPINFTTKWGKQAAGWTLNKMYF